MKPLSSARTAGGLTASNSPIPYLFGGLAAMLCLIAFALIMLFCSYRKNSGQGGTPEDPLEKPAKPATVLNDMEQKVVVIMAGDHCPTFIAKPCSCGEKPESKTEEPVGAEIV
ncbi:protein GLUTAMINE DUMPER 5-like [Nymphaea colorata]|uniref:protein GLUTAMINE DUMPER 5-like n=1 Tax=Nymphaea colorata TaxID=210225 RepID=UPI00129E590C|nr:protein GLUTAMINE DUMPER 5-like [Nymphaea colorata]